MTTDTRLHQRCTCTAWKLEQLGWVVKNHAPTCPLYKLDKQK